MKDLYSPPHWNPFQLFLMLLAFTSSLPLLQGQSGSAILDAQLDTVDVVLWGICLLVGSGLDLIGMLTPWRRRHFGMVIERAGLILVGGAAGIYTYVILHAAPSVGAVRYAAAIQLAFSLACVYRTYQITRALRWIAHTAPLVTEQATEQEYRDHISQDENDGG